MNKNIPKEKQLTIAKYLVEVIENKKIYQPYDKFSLFIDPKEFDLRQDKNLSENDFINYVIKTYIESLEDKLIEFSETKSKDYDHNRQINRTLKRLIKALKQHIKKSTLSINWQLNFHMPVYGIDVYRANILKRKLMPKEQKQIPEQKTQTSQNNYICLATWHETESIQVSPYEPIAKHKVQKRRAFRNILEFDNWCESEPIKSKDIQLQTFKNAKCIDDIVINSDKALKHLIKTLESKKGK